jgi:hypothetical protein
VLSSRSLPLPAPDLLSLALTTSSSVSYTGFSLQAVQRQ